MCYYFVLHIKGTYSLTFLMCGWCKLSHFCFTLEGVTWELGKDCILMGQEGHAPLAPWALKAVGLVHCGFYLYAWPGIFPERWLDTRWQRPLQPPLLRSRHGQCRAAQEHWDLRRDAERESWWKCQLVRLGSKRREQQTVHNRAKRKEMIISSSFLL